MGADIGDKISSQPDRQDRCSLFLAVLLLRLSLFLQSCTVPQEELGQDRKKRQAGDNLDTGVRVVQKSMAAFCARVSH